MKLSKKKAINSILRLLPMAAKMLLTLYMGKFFSLADIGIYGLVMGAVSVLSVIFGQNFAYVVNRDIVGVPNDVALHKIRDEVLLYGANYIVFALVIGALLVGHTSMASPSILVFTFVLTVLEGLGTVTYFNMNSLNQQIAANMTFFIRAGLWVFPVLALCLVNPEYRTANTVLCAWAVGSTLSLGAVVWHWRYMPWRLVMKRPVNWEWLIKGVKVSSLVWLGMIGLTAGSFVDRFVLQHYLTLTDVGVVTFYFSFTNALSTLMQSGVSAFATPRLVQHHRDGNHDAFHQEAKQALTQIMIGGGVIAVGLGITVPLLAEFLGKEALVAGMVTFWLMLAGAWVRANADMLNNVLFARHQDRAIWLGNLLFLIPALGGNIVLIPFLGLHGVGVSAVLAATLLFTWRQWHVRVMPSNQRPKGGTRAA